jgi:long-chain acyl-CoA synthetase
VSLACVYTRTSLGHVPDDSDNPRDLFTDLGVFRPRVIVADADLLGRFHDAARVKAYADGNMTVFDTAEQVAMSYGAHTAGPAPLALRLKHAVASRVVYPKLRAAFGGRCVATFTSGEPLDTGRVNFYRGIGIDIHELAPRMS